MPVTPDQFKGALRSFVSGVTVVTAHGAGGDEGITVSAFNSVSIDPPLVLVCIQKGKPAHAAIDDARAFAVSILGEGQRALSDRFAWRRSPDEDRFADLGAQRGAASGAPLLPGARATLDCTLYAAYDGGDHTIFVGEVQDAVVDSDAGGALLYAEGRYRLVGDAL